MTDVLNYPTGAILQFTYGEYSDFCTCGLLVAIRPCNLPVLVAEYTAALERDGELADFDTPPAFVSWLVANQYAVPVDVSEVHLGAYGRFDVELKPR